MRYAENVALISGNSRKTRSVAGNRRIDWELSTKYQQFSWKSSKSRESIMLAFTRPPELIETVWTKSENCAEDRQNLAAIDVTLESKH